MCKLLNLAWFIPLMGMGLSACSWQDGSSQTKGLYPVQTMNVSMLALTSSETVIYYANETAPTSQEQANFNAIISALTAAQNGASPADAQRLEKVVDSLKRDQNIFPQTVDAEINALESVLCANPSSSTSLIVFTNRLARQGQYLACDAGKPASVGTDSKFSAAIATARTIARLESSPLATPSVFKAALKVAGARFDTSSHSFVLITKSHGSDLMALTPRIVIDASKMTQSAIASLVLGPSQSAKSLDKDGLDKDGLDKDGLDKDGLDKDEMAGQTDPTQTVGITKADFFASLGDLGATNNGQTPMRFPLIFMESCKSYLSNNALAQIATFMAPTVGRVYSSDANGIDYTTVSYPDFADYAKRGLSFASFLSDALEQKAAAEKSPPSP